jgi:hypothetical protein
MGVVPKNYRELFEFMLVVRVKSIYREQALQSVKAFGKGM